MVTPFLVFYLGARGVPTAAHDADRVDRYRRGARARFTALAVGTAVYATVGPAVVWWFSLVAGICAAAGVGALSPTISRRTAHTADAARPVARLRRSFTVQGHT
jgi:hypothetical protein